MIREFKSDDIDKIADIWLDTNIRAHDFIPRSYWVNNYYAVKKMLPRSEIFVYENGGEINGFIGLSDNFIEGIFVREGARSKGIGRQLLHHAKRTKNSLTLRVYSRNGRAVRFYEREGFTVISVMTDENTGEEELLMSWERSGEER